MSANSEKTEETKSDAKLSNKMDSIELKLEEMHAQDSVQSPSTPLPGGIGVFADFVIGACSALADGVSKASVEHFEKKYIGITACTATEGPGVQGETIGTSDEEIRGVFGTPDGADRQPVHSDAGSPHRSQAPQNLQKNACTNEMHAIAKEGNWTTLRSRLTTASDHSHTVNLTGQVDQKGRTPLMLGKCLFNCARFSNGNISIAMSLLNQIGVFIALLNAFIPLFQLAFMDRSFRQMLRAFFSSQITSQLQSICFKRTEAGITACIKQPLLDVTSRFWIFCTARIQEQQPHLMVMVTCLCVSNYFCLFVVALNFK